LNGAGSGLRSLFLGEEFMEKSIHSAAGGIARRSGGACLALLLATTALVTIQPETTLAQTAPQSSGAAVLAPVMVEGKRTDSLDAAQITPDVYAGGQMARGGRLGVLGNRDFMDTPLSITSFTSQFVEDQQATTAADVVANDPSVRVSNHSGSILDAFFIRGFPVNEGNIGDVAFDGVYGVAPTYRILTEYAERIEVVKGPTAFLYGMAPNSAVGGAINIVPKRALDIDLTRLTLDFSEDSQLGAKTDVSRRYGANREFGVRANASYHAGDTQLDNQSKESSVGAVAFDYRGEKIRLSADVIAQEEKWNAPSRPLFLTSGIATPSTPDAHRNITQKWEWSELSDEALLLKADFNASENVLVFANLGGGHSEVARLFGTPSMTAASGATTVTPQYFLFDINRVVADVGTRVKFDTEMVNHTATVQVTRYHDDISRGSTNGTAYTTNIFNPIDQPAQSVARPASVPRLSETDIVGVSIADTLSILDDRAQLTLGLRNQRVEGKNFAATGAVTSAFDESANSPFAGVVVKPWQNVSLYTSYIEGLSKGDVAPTGATNVGEVLAPYISEQYEAGAKFDFGRIATTVSVFQLTKPSGQLAGGVYSAGGEQRNRGIELSAFGEIMPSVRLLGGVTLVDAELTKTNSAATVGNRPIGVPEVTANLGLEWDLPYIRGLTLGATLAYTGQQYVNTANTQTVPSWTRLDLGARYATEIVRTPATFRLAVRNVTDENYWSGVSSFGGLGQGLPRTVMLSTSFDF
jgi:iron complex outermembrane receptor protein